MAQSAKALYKLPSQFPIIQVGSFYVEWIGEYQILISMGVHGLDCFYTKYILPQIWKICRKWKVLDCFFFHCSLPSSVEKISGGSPILYQICPSAVVGCKARQFGWLLSAFLFFGRLGNLGVGLFTWTRGNIEE